MKWKWKWKLALPVLAAIAMALFMCHAQEARAQCSNGVCYSQPLMWQQPVMIHQQPVQVTRIQLAAADPVPLTPPVIPSQPHQIAYSGPIYGHPCRSGPVIYGRHCDYNRRGISLSLSWGQQCRGSTCFRY